MEKCQKCNGVMLQMKIKRSAMPENEKKQGWRCSRCGYYVEKQQIFAAGQFGDYQKSEDPYLRRKQA